MLTADAHRLLADRCIQQGALDGDCPDRERAGDSIARALDLPRALIDIASDEHIDRWAATFATRQSPGWQRRAA